MCTATLCIPWQRRSSKALRPFSGDVYGWVFCAKNWQLEEVVFYQAVEEETTSLGKRLVHASLEEHQEALALLDRKSVV